MNSPHEATAAATYLLRHVLIEKYRAIISQRYDTLIDHIDSTTLLIDAVIARRLKDFFLTEVYPSTERRIELDAAFIELSHFVEQPTLIWGLVGSLPIAIFKFGRQLPNALKAAFQCLEAYNAATGFEVAIWTAAQQQGLYETITDDEFTACIKAIPRHQLELFIAQGCQLFITLSNTELLAKTIEIMQDVISRMKAKPAIYNSNQIAAIELGLEMIQGGYELLLPYDAATKANIVAFISQTETKFIAEIFN